MTYQINQIGNFSGMNMPILPTRFSGWPEVFAGSGVMRGDFSSFSRELTREMWMPSQSGAPDMSGASGMSGGMVGMLNDMFKMVQSMFQRMMGLEKIREKIRKLKIENRKLGTDTFIEN